MARAPIYVSRVIKLPLLDAADTTIGRIADVVIGPPYLTAPPVVVGFVATVQRRRIFVNMARVGRLDAAGVALRSGAIDIRHFHQREGELLASADLLDHRFRGDFVNDIGLECVEDPGAARWVVATVSLRPPGAFRRRSRSRIVAWWEVAPLFDLGQVGRELAALRALHPSDRAAKLREIPLERRLRLAAAFEDEELADVLEELPEDEQVEIVEGLDRERAADVLEEMAPDDAADLLGEMPSAMRVQLLDAMEPDEAAPVRRLLLYEEDTAGGLMNPEPVVVPAGTSVAEALARVRDAELPAALAAHVFVTDLPVQTPTGHFYGTAGFQRLLREPPGMTVERCLDEHITPISPTLSATEVAERLAAYNLVALPVCDEAGRLLGAVTVDDVLDRALPEGWRAEHGEPVGRR